MIIKFAILLLFVVILSDKIDLNVENFISIDVDYLYIILGLVITSIATVLSSFRWGSVLKLVPVGCGPLELVNYTYVGAYFNVFFPGDMGGDFVKTYCVAKDKKEKISRIVSTVIIDRVIGLLTMLVIPGVILVFNEINIKVVVFEKYIEIDLLIYFGAAVVTVIILTAMRIGRYIKNISKKNINNRIIGGALSKMSEMLDGYVDKTDGYVSAVMWSFLSQFFLYIGGYYIALSIVDEIALVSWFVVYPIIVALSSLPITFSGLGLREYLFVVFAVVIGIGNNEQAVIVSIIIFLSLMSQSVIGAILYNTIGDRSGLDKIRISGVKKA